MKSSSGQQTVLRVERAGGWVTGDGTICSESTSCLFALMVQSLLERELRQVIRQKGVESLRLYPEGGPCFRATTRQVLAPFASIARHTILASGRDDFEILNTEQAPIHQEFSAY